MLGWPSPTYPKLLPENSPIPINLDQTAMVAGFLMLGNFIGAPLSACSYPGNKYGLLIALILMSIGWAVMWQARSIYWLLGSRITVGLGTGYGIGLLKTYIKNLCHINIAGILLKLINLHIMLGILLAFCLGPFLSLKMYPLVCTIMTIVIFFLCVFLPHTPMEYLKIGDETNCKKRLQILYPFNVEEELHKLKLVLAKKDVNMSFGQVLRNRTSRSNVIFLGLMIFFQQFSGPTATIVYSQIIFSEIGYDTPELLAIGYILILIVASLFGLFALAQLNMKYCLLLSSVLMSFSLVIHILSLYYDLNANYWSYISYVALLFYIFTHSMSWGCMPFLILEEIGSKESKLVISHFMWMLYSVLGLIITKIFQVLFGAFPLFVPFCLFLTISLISIVFVLILYPNRISVPNKTSKI